MFRRGFLFLALAATVLAAGGCRIRPPRGAQPVERTLLTTGYCKCGECCGWRRTWYGKPVYSGGALKVGITASGSRATRGTLAADPKTPFGTIIYVPGYGYGRVEDRGSGIVGDHIDLYFHTHRQAKQWGRKRLRVKIWYPGGKCPRR
jgi:3D (Asp-Asp-Asp) domain-containing protein